MSEDSFHPSELQQAERLEQYLQGLDQKNVVPADATPADVELYALARAFHAWKQQPDTLMPPVVSLRRRLLRRIASWAIPVPIMAAATVWFLLWRTQPVDVTAELATIAELDQELLAVETELSGTLDEIDLLTSTDYIDQL